MPVPDVPIGAVAALIDAQPKGRRQIGVVALCGTIALLDGFDLQAIGLAAPAIATALRISPSVLGAVFSAALAGLALGALLYPTAIRATGIGWAMEIGRLGSFVGPLVVGTLVSARPPIEDVFLSVGSAALLAAAPCALTGAGRRASPPEALVH